MAQCVVETTYHRGGGSCTLLGQHLQFLSHWSTVGCFTSQCDSALLKVQQLPNDMNPSPFIRQWSLRTEIIFAQEMAYNYQLLHLDH